MRFFLFTLATAALFMRPSDLIPEIIGATAGVYEVLILACLAVSLPRVLAQLTPASLAENPVTLCAVGVLASIGVSGLLNSELSEARTNAQEFCKVIIYYLLLVSTIDSGSRARAFLYWLNVFILAITTLALLQYHGVIDIPSLAATPQRQEDDEETGEAGIVLLRLCGPEIFHNPNDLARIIAIGMILCLYGMSDRRSPIPRVLWLVPLGGLGYALVLTYSRGGFLTMVAALAALAGHWLGTRKLVALGVLLVPVILAAKGRQTDVSLDKGTANERIRLWRDGLEAMLTAPVMGVGPETYPELTGGLVAHNSFVHAYTEIGFVGGTLFLGAYGCALLVLYRLGPSRANLADQKLVALRPFVLALLVGYGIGMMSSSRSYWVVTYMLFALATAVFSTAAAPGRVPRFRLEWRGLCRLIAASAVVLTGFFVWVRVILG